MAMPGAREQGQGTERLGISVGLEFAEAGRHSTQFMVEKWDIDQINWTLRKDYDDVRLIRPGMEPVARHFREYRCLPYETYIEEDCNLILDTGWQYLMNGIAGSAVTKFANGTGRIGLGTSATAVAYTDTALGAIGALTTHNWEVLNAVPTVGSTHTAGLILAAQFPTGDANGVAIAEFGTDLGTVAALTVTPTAPFVTHGNATPGTKTSAQTWNATVTITWT